MSIIQVKADHVSTEAAYAQVAARSGIDEIDDAVAVTIASWWQSPGTVGRHLAALASGAAVEYQNLADDLYATRKAEHYYGSGLWPQMAQTDRQALDALSTWALQRTRADRNDYKPARPARMRYASIVFQQGDDAAETLRIIEREGPMAGIAHLSQWWSDSDPYAYETYDNPPHGSEDHTFAYGELILSWSLRYGYVGLAMRFPES